MLVVCQTPGLAIGAQGAQNLTDGTCAAQFLQFILLRASPYLALPKHRGINKLKGF